MCYKIIAKNIRFFWIFFNGEFLWFLEFSEESQQLNYYTLSPKPATTKTGLRVKPQIVTLPS